MITSSARQQRGRTGACRPVVWTPPSLAETGQCARRKEPIWRTARGIRSLGSFHGNMLTSAFGASIVASIAPPLGVPVTGWNLTVAERVLLFRIASSTEWQEVGITGEAAQSEPCYHLLPVHTVPCYLTRKWRIWRRISESCFRGRLRQTTYKPLISNGPCAGVNRVL